MSTEHESDYDDYNSDNDEDDDFDDEKEDSRLLHRIRLVIGGLLLPTMIVSIDKLAFNLVFKKKPTLLRTIMVG